MPNLRAVLEGAGQTPVAVGHFNVSDLVGFKAVISAARRLNVPAFVGVSEGERAFVGLAQIAALVRSVRDRYGHPVFLNADHTHTLQAVEAAARAGFDEVIFDLSDQPFEENLKQTKRAVELLKSIRPELLVEGEIGYIGRSSEIISHPPESLAITTPEESVQFVSETGIDVLAPAVGNMHGLLPSMVRGDTRKRLDIERIRQIKQQTPAFLTLHGGSGTADQDFVAAIRAGITIIHINTELRLAWRRGIEKGLKAHPKETAPYKILPTAVNTVETVVADRLRLFNNLSGSPAAVA
ncbi:MAG TPA: class II fructose-bisphosphate aldolase [Terriglobales bacterium]|nr:class II fructose-bisphosphate aldolase [Terriglobales bacterium]